MSGIHPVSHADSHVQSPFHRGALSRRHFLQAGGLALGAAAVAAQTRWAVPAEAAPATTPMGGGAAAGATVASGQARFQVLSPTLIRAEYAADGQFENHSTFNVIGRSGFPRTHFRTTRHDGWLVIDTGRTRLQYKEGSGRFTDANLTLSLAAGRQHVTTSPWDRAGGPLCTPGALYQAEDLRPIEVPTATDHKGYGGRGFLAGFTNPGNSAVSFTADIPDDDGEQGLFLHLRYSNGDKTTKTMHLSIDGVPAAPISLASTSNWDTWAVQAVALGRLSAGQHTVAVNQAADDTGKINVDSLAVLTSADADYPTQTAPTSAPCSFGQVCGAQTGRLSGGAAVAVDHNGYSGSGFVAGFTKAGATDTLTVTGVPRAGVHELQLRYSNWLALHQTAPQDRTITVTDAAGTHTATLPPTSSWSTWRTARIRVRLSKGTSTLTVGCGEGADGHVNLDTVALTAVGAPELAPHAGLGGYRRGLDRLDGDVSDFHTLTTPGLLWQDGWSLLDDTCSALFDPDTQKVSRRPDHHDKPYQDGYLFAYGQDYRQALADLATLTGPSKLLPRWAYGLWFSEYRNRTAADYQKLVKTFRDNKVPLDVLGVDTDYKSPNTWNGWEIDTAKFPDPKAFLDQVHAQGLHTTLNIHPTIAADDPQFPAAQKTSKGALKTSGDRIGFDLGDPDQLKALLDLHRAVAPLNDLWWNDWCDGSTSTLAGVSPDTWFNMHYADMSSKALGRGFAFGRSFGSFSANGYDNPAPVPTGPWAEKRTTLHFTADVVSDWGSLKYEVGYTGGESAATGLVAISHDIGGHYGGLNGPAGSGADPKEGYQAASTKLPDDLYVRWLQLGTFQPIDRLHSANSDRLPWQYGDKDSEVYKAAVLFLRLRERLVPYTYTLAQQATRTGLPIVRPPYLQYPQQAEAYAQADSEYLYGPDILVAPVTVAGTTATTTVWFPAGSSWTDVFTGRTYRGGASAQITTGWQAMPVFLRSGGIVTTRTNDVTGDLRNPETPTPLDEVTLTVAAGADGTCTLYEDDGTTDDSASAVTRIAYRQWSRSLRIDPVRGRFPGQVGRRAWTVSFRNAGRPSAVLIDGRPTTAWRWDRATRTLTVAAPGRSVTRGLVVGYR